jgi:hypothetical protein
MSEAEVLTPEMAREEAAAMNADKDHPLHDPGHFKHLAAVDHLQTLLNAIDATPAEQRDEQGIQTTADLEEIMAPAMEPVGSPEDFSFDAFDRPEGSEWDVEQESAFREIFHAAQLSQGEADQLLTIASDNAPVDVQRTEAVLQNRYKGNEEQMQTDIALARAAVRQIGGQPLADYLNETGLGDHIAFFDLALRKAKQMGIS